MKNAVLSNSLKSILARTDLTRGAIEQFLIKNGSNHLIGVDEVGRGCIAGPVHAAAVCLDYEALAKLPEKTKALIRDSKKLSAKQRQSIIKTLDSICISYSVGCASVEEIESLGIVTATFTAMHRAINDLGAFDNRFLLIDGRDELRDYVGSQLNVIKGDSLCYCIAAASIFAKVARDSFMQDQASVYPGYGFEKHVGYGTAAHISHLKELGVTSLHRKNFAPIKNML